LRWNVLVNSRYKEISFLFSVAHRRRQRVLERGRVPVGAQREEGRPGQGRLAAVARRRLLGTRNDRR
jgi:hypothetical protein